MKKYEVKVLSYTGMYESKYILENARLSVADSGYYYFQTEDGLGHFFPINKTIITQLKTD